MAGKYPMKLTSLKLVSGINKVTPIYTSWSAVLHLLKNEGFISIVVTWGLRKFDNVRGEESDLYRKKALAMINITSRDIIITVNQARRGNKFDIRNNQKKTSTLVKKGWILTWNPIHSSQCNEKSWNKNFICERV